jgi:class 3 adenylate cyclase
MNDQHCNEAAAWTCRQTALSSGHRTIHSVDEATRCVSSAGETQIVTPMQSFVPGVVAHYLTHQDLPITRELAVLFVDLADSTRLLVQQPPTQALFLIQRFTEMVTDIAVAHCGDVKDYEGDGALLYFASIVHATRAALAMRTAFAALQTSDGHTVQARLSLNVGEVTIGVIGSASRRSVALIGPTVNLAARLLKHVAPGGIITPQTVIDRLQQEAPTLARAFRLQGTCLTVRDFEAQCVTAYSLPYTGGEASLQSLMSGGQNHIVIDQTRGPKHQSRDGSGVSTPDAIFCSEGEYWTVSFAGTTCRLKDARGLHYLAHLLQHPHREVHVLTLITLSADLNEGPAHALLLQDSSLPFDLTEGFSDAGEILDPQARAAYKQRLSELQEELAEAQNFHDLGRSEQLATEIDFLTHELASAVGLGGRARRAGSPAERARVNITRAVKIALRKITEHHPALGRHLTTTLKTGTYCSYTPDPRLLITWRREAYSRDTREMRTENKNYL